jgi:hypothetical protein
MKLNRTALFGLVFLMVAFFLPIPAFTQKSPTGGTISKSAAVPAIDLNFEYYEVVKVLKRGEKPPKDANGKPYPVMSGPFSSTAGKYAYTKVKITSEEQLLALLQKSSPDGKLSIAQEQLLASYRYSSSPNMIKRLQLAAKCGGKDVTVKLCDTSLAENDSSVPDEKVASLTELIRRDFWPHSNSWNHSIVLSSGYFDNNTSDSAVSVLSHEVSHSFDRNMKEIKGYGPDGMHSINEITKPRAAFLEAWAEYNEMIDFPEIAKNARESLKTVFLEKSPPPKEGDKMEKFPLDSLPDGNDYFRVEGVMALVMFEMSKKMGVDRLNQVFYEVNPPWIHPFSKMDDFLKKAVSFYPEFKKDIFRILNQETFGRVPDDRMKKIFGASAETEAWLRQRVADIPATFQPGTGKSSPSVGDTGGDGFGKD